MAKRRDTPNRINLANVLNPQRMRRVLQTKTSGKSATGAPIFPGAASGLSIKDIRKLISLQPRQRGFTTQVAAGLNEITGIKLPGDSKLLLGINFNAIQITTSADTYSLSINNNEIVENVAVLLNSTVPGAGGIAYTMEPYIRLMQPLSGTDDIELAYTAGAPGTIQFVLWYI